MRFTLRQIDAMPDGPVKRAMLRALNPPDKAAPPKPAKYRNVRTPGPGGRTYDSKAEAQRAGELDVMRRAGAIWQWFPQVRFVLTGVPYTCDFLVFEKPGVCWAEDAKGHETQRFRDVRRLWRECGPCELRVVKREGGRLVTVETVTPGA